MYCPPSPYIPFCLQRLSKVLFLLLAQYVIARERYLSISGIWIYNCYSAKAVSRYLLRREFY